MIKTAEAKPLAALGHYPVQEPIILNRNEVGIINDNWLVADAAGISLRSVSERPRDV